MLRTQPGASVRCSLDFGRSHDENQHHLRGTTLVCAASAISTGTAAAELPEFKVAGGFPNPFTSKNKAGTEPTINGTLLGIAVTVKCKSSTDAGEINAAKEIINLSFTYKGCRLGTSAAECTTPGQAKGAIISVVMNAKPGYINKILGKVGLQLKPKAGTTIIHFTCEGVGTEAVLSGCVIGEATPINVFTTSSDLTFSATGTTQTVTKFEAGKNARCRCSEQKPRSLTQRKRPIRNRWN